MTWIQARSKVIIYRPCANFLASGWVLSLVTKTTPTLRSEFQQLTIRLPQPHRDGEMSPEISVINCKIILRGGLGGGDEKIAVGKAVLSSTGTCGLTWIYCLAGPTAEAVRTFVMKEKMVTCLSKHPSYVDTVLCMTCKLNSLWPWILTSFISKKNLCLLCL